MKTWIATLLACAALLTAGWAMAGDMTPPAGPDQPTMNTLQEIHDDVQALENRLNRAPTRKTGMDFSVPEEHEGGDNDDGGLQKGVASPDPRFTDNGDGTVTDNLTGLIWLQDPRSLGGEVLTWEKALKKIYRLEHGQYGLSDGSRKGDWRLPSVNEMQSLFIFNYEVEDPALRDGHPFDLETTDGGKCLTSTSVSWYQPEKFVWTVQLGTGRTDAYLQKDKTADLVWPVRGGMYGQ